MKKIKKILQNSFKFFFYKAFALIYGNIKGKINPEKDSRIKIETIKKENNLKYRIYKIKNTFFCRKHFTKYLPVKTGNEMPVFDASGLLLCVDNVKQFYFNYYVAG